MLDFLVRLLPDRGPDPLQVVAADRVLQLDPGRAGAGRAAEDRGGPVGEGDPAVGRAPAPLAETRGGEGETGLLRPGGGGGNQAAVLCKGRARCTAAW